MATLLKYTFLLCLVLLPLSCWYGDDFDADLDVLTTLTIEPKQTATDATSFRVEQADVRYEIEPVYDYELYGLVVSMRHHDGDRMLHRLWNDHLNVADLCVVWGHNADMGRLQKFDFRSGQFTCFFRTRDERAWRQFRPDQLSNNHLLADDPYIRDVIADVRVGDQVFLRGHLARYGNDSGFKRGTSESRDDTGNGACETIYVRDFRVLRTMDTFWRGVAPMAWFGLLLSGAGWLVGVTRGAI